MDTSSSTPTQTKPEDETYFIPIRFRKIENLHIVFWLFKDISWCMVWRPLGITMIFPTLITSLVIVWRTKQYKSELFHNLAITFWIMANSYWMISEFLLFDTKPLYGSLSFKHLALIPFIIGISILGFYYLIWKPRNKNEFETM